MGFKPPTVIRLWETFTHYILIIRISGPLFLDTAPEFTNLDHKVIIYPSWVAGAIVYTVSVDDLDSYDLGTLEVTMADDITEVFLFDRSTCKFTYDKLQSNKFKCT